VGQQPQPLADASGHFGDFWTRAVIPVDGKITVPDPATTADTCSLNGTYLILEWDCALLTGGDVAGLGW
jgi:hypothetical protein